MESTEPEFWEQRYQTGRMPWDANGVPRAVTNYILRGPPNGRVLIPGCGSGYEVRAWHAAGWEVTAIDFSPAAVALACGLLGELGGRVRVADFFGDGLGEGYDLIYERTFLCSLPTERWSAYVQRMAELLRPGGVLAGFFFYGQDPEPPPYPLTLDTAAELFGKNFRLIEDRAVPADESLALYAGAERWQVWQKPELTLSGSPPALNHARL
jgi:SAM-dependent methyltransferase